MLIIHAAFADNSFYLWGERSFDAADLERAEGSSSLPWCADVGGVIEALREAGLKSAKKYTDKQAVSAFVTLPSCGGLPLPSSRLLGELPEQQGETELRVYQVNALPVSREDMADGCLALAHSDGERLAVPGLLLADDVRYMSKALEFAALYAARGAFVPDMETRGSCFYSVWKPLFLAKYQDEYKTFIEAAPPVLLGFSTEPGAQLKNRAEVARPIFEIFLDGLVRDAQNALGARGRKVDPDNPHEIWLRALTWPSAPLDRWGEAMESLYPQIRAWSGSLETVTSQAWRLFMRLEEPSEDEQDIWTLSWHIQSVQDPSLVIPAARVWAPGPAERAWFSHVGANPRRYMLAMLGHLASFVPAIARSLDKACPVDCRLNLDELFEFLRDHVPSILDQGIQIQLPATWGSLSERPRLAVHGTVRDAAAFQPGGQLALGDLLEVDWSVSLGDDVLTEEELQTLTELKTPLANIRGRWVLLYRDELEKVLEGMKKLPDKIDRREALVSSFSESRGDLPISSITGSAWLDDVRAMLTGVKKTEDLEQPQGFSGSLRPYQKHGFSWLSEFARLGLGACLADDMGLGKTVQTLALVRQLRNDGEKRPVLLICPTSVIENWRRETEKFTPGLPVLIHHGAKRLKGGEFAQEAAGSAVVLSSYALLHRDNTLFSGVSWAGVVLDEAQNIKNPDTRQARAARSLTADWRFALTGTPVENHVGDMWSLMEFLVPGLLPNKTKFSRDFLRPIQAGDAKAMEKIKKMTGPFILRRLKTDKDIISDLPEKIESQEFCPLSREQASLYGAVLSSLDEEISGSEGIRRKGLVLAAITSLKQICDHPALYLKDNSEIEGRSGKLARLAEIAEEMLSAGDRTLIFTQYAEMGALLKKFLQETFGRETLFLHGGVPREKRDEMVRRFQESSDAPPFFVLSLKAGGTGLNLTGANHVVMFDRWWNPAVEQQAVDRAYRIGQTSSVQVHYFCCRGTLEEKIEALIASKKHVADAVVSTGEQWLTEFSDDELHELFSLGRDAVEDLK